MNCYYIHSTPCIGNNHTTYHIISTLLNTVLNFYIFYSLYICTYTLISATVNAPTAVLFGLFHFIVHCDGAKWS